MLTCIVFNSQRARPDKRNKPVSHKRLNSLEGTLSSASHQSTTHRSASSRLGFARGRKTISQPPTICVVYHQTKPVSTPASNHPTGHYKPVPGGTFRAHRAPSATTAETGLYANQSDKSNMFSIRNVAGIGPDRIPTLCVPRAVLRRGFTANYINQLPVLHYYRYARYKALYGTAFEDFPKSKINHTATLCSNHRFRNRSQKMRMNTKHEPVFCSVDTLAQDKHWLHCERRRISSFLWTSAPCSNAKSPSCETSERSAS